MVLCLPDRIWFKEQKLCGIFLGRGGLKNHFWTVVPQSTAYSQAARVAPCLEREVDSEVPLWPYLKGGYPVLKRMKREGGIEASAGW